MLAQKSTDAITSFIPSVVQLLKMTYDDACSRYVELFLEREGTDSMADKLSQQTLLVFLVDDTDILPTRRPQRQDSHDSGETDVAYKTVDCLSVTVMTAGPAVLAVLAAELIVGK